MSDHICNFFKPHDKRSSTTVLPDDQLVQLEIKVQNICLIDSWYLPCIDAIPRRAEIHSGSGWAKLPKDKAIDVLEISDLRRYQSIQAAAKSVVGAGSAGRKDRAPCAPRLGKQESGDIPEAGATTVPPARSGGLDSSARERSPSFSALSLSELACHRARQQRFS